METLLLTKKKKKTKKTNTDMKKTLGNLL